MNSHDSFEVLIIGSSFGGLSVAIRLEQAGLRLVQIRLFSWL
jgi:2-polyprenyl-6-methoxyphenol hydroxylase-like FAD-dependent oxidoreductase